MRLSSPDFTDGGALPPHCQATDAKCRPPVLRIDDAPPATRSFALVADNRDAGKHHWVQWLAWNIPPETREIRPANLPAGTVEGVTDCGGPGWHGTDTPPEGQRLQFKLYALDAPLELAETAGHKELDAAAAPHLLAQALLVGIAQPI